MDAILRNIHGWWVFNIKRIEAVIENMMALCKRQYTDFGWIDQHGLALGRETVIFPNENGEVWKGPMITLLSSHI